MGYTQSKNDYNLFLKQTNDSITLVSVYVDDIIITGNDPLSITSLKIYLHDTFSIKDLGKLHYFLGIEINYLPLDIFLSQNNFTQDLLKASGVSFFKLAVTPLPPNLKHSAHEGTPYTDPEFNRKMVAN